MTNMPCFIKNISIKEIIIMMSLYFTMVGSFFYIGSQSFSIGFVLTPVLIVYIFVYWLNNGISFKKIDLYFLLFWLLFLIGSVMAVVAHPVEDNFRVIKFLYQLVVIFFALSVMQKKGHTHIYNNAVFWLLWTVWIICLLQISYTLFGWGLQQENFWFIVSLPYGNANNLGVVALIIFIHSVYQHPKHAIILITISSIIIFLAASRLVISVWFLLFVFNFKKMSFIYKLLLILVVIPCILLIANTEFMSYSIDRILSIETMWDYTNADESSSTFERIGSYLYFVRHIFDINGGSLVFKEYSYFYTGSIFSDGLMEINPHNIFVELSLLYGWLGLVACIFLVVWLFSSVKINFKQNLITIMIGLCMVLCIPSSIINFIPLWCLLIGLLLNQGVSKPRNIM